MLWQGLGMRTLKVQLTGHIRLEVEYTPALFKYYHGNNPSCGALLCSHKLFEYRHSDTPLISARVMSWQHYLPLLCSSVLFWSLSFFRIWLIFCLAKDTERIRYSVWSQLLFAAPPGMNNPKNMAARGKELLHFWTVYRRDKNHFYLVSLCSKFKTNRRTWNETEMRSLISIFKTGC